MYNGYFFLLSTAEMVISQIHSRHSESDDGDLVMAYKISARLCYEFSCERCAQSLLLATGNVNRWTELCISRTNLVAVQWHNQCLTPLEVRINFHHALSLMFHCSLVFTIELSNELVFFVVLERERTPEIWMNKIILQAVVGNSWLLHGICCCWLEHVVVFTFFFGFYWVSSITVHDSFAKHSVIAHSTLACYAYSQPISANASNSCPLL